MKKIFCIFLLCFLINSVEKKENICNTNNSQEKNSEKYINNIFSNTYKNTRYTPVMIYKKTNIKNRVVFCGMGSVFRSDNKNLILTSEHLFKESSKFLYMYKNMITGKLGDIKNTYKTGYQLTEENADVILLETGKNEKITGVYSTRTRDGVYVDMFGEKEVFFVTSTITGKKTRVLGIGTQENIKYLIINYSPIDGESGTGFVDEQNYIYVLKGSVNEGKLAVVYGPLSF